MGPHPQADNRLQAEGNSYVITQKTVTSVQQNNLMLHVWEGGS